MHFPFQIRLNRRYLRGFRSIDSFLSPLPFASLRASGVKDKEGMLEMDTLVIGNGSQIEGKLLGALQRNFLQVQSILDQNRLLINEINQNHESRIPDNLSRNVGLIRELNDNIRRVVDLYGNLSVSFADSKDADSDGKQRGHKRNKPA